ncbi:hypothetical protein F8S13_21140 [Chloroflexia bacterium SDU3-3]|nr:hypothetical protein F8S13_21140 [Chloroflexia bacterium SDU3-3]
MVLAALTSAIETFVLPRAVSDVIVRGVFVAVRRVFSTYTNTMAEYAQRDSAMALFSPMLLLLLALAWVVMIMAGYTLLFLAAGEPSWADAFLLSGSSLLTLGFSTVDGIPEAALAFSEAALGLVLIALLISYLPTMYSAFARREAAVTLLAVRAGEPPFAAELLSRYQRIKGMGQLSDLWRSWEVWFAEIEESHTSYPALVFFRSPQPGHSWVTAAGTILDAAALRSAVLNLPRDSQADLTLRAGYLALRRIADYFGIRYPENPQFPETPISISKEEFLQACAEMHANHVPLRADLDQAWRDFAGWRVNYDAVVLALAVLTVAPYAQWTSDRTLPAQRLPRRLSLGLPRRR